MNILKYLILNKIEVQLFLLATLSTPFLSLSQSIFPPFNKEQLEIRLSKSMPGIMDDEDNTKGDSLVYILKGQLFENKEGEIQKTTEGFNGQSNRSTPWETLTELLSAYESRDINKIIDLYDNSSQAQVEAIFKGQNAEQVLDQVSNAGDVYVLAGFEYKKKGYYAISETKNLGIVANYFVKVKGKYKLSALQDENPLSWNIALYFKFKPEPLVPPELISYPDSVNVNDDIKLEFQLKDEGRWIILFRETVGEAAVRLVEDNGTGDEDLSLGRVSISIQTKVYFNIGEYELLSQESNYPIQRVTTDIIPNALKIPIKVYE